MLIGPLTLIASSTVVGLPPMPAEPSLPSVRPLSLLLVLVKLALKAKKERTKPWLKPALKGCAVKVPVVLMSTRSFQ